MPCLGTHLYQVPYAKVLWFVVHSSFSSSPLRFRAALASQGRLGGLTGLLDTPRQFTATGHSLSFVWTWSSWGDGEDPARRLWLKGFEATAECVAVPEDYLEVTVDDAPTASSIEVGHRALFRFHAVQGQTYIVTSVDADFDAVLCLVSAGAKVLAQSDDDGDGNQPAIVWTAPETRSWGVIVRGWGDDAGSFSVQVRTTQHPDCDWERVSRRLETDVISELHTGLNPPISASRLLPVCMEACMEDQACLAVDTANGVCRLHSSSMTVAAPTPPPIGSGHRRLQTQNYPLLTADLTSGSLSTIDAPPGATVLTVIPGWETWVFGSLLPPSGGALVLSSIQGQCRWYLNCPEAPAANLPEFILSEFNVPTGGVSLRVADQRPGSSAQAWSDVFPVPPVKHEKKGWRWHLHLLSVRRRRSRVDLPVAPAVLARHARRPSALARPDGRLPDRAAR